MLFKIIHILLSTTIFLLSLKTLSGSSIDINDKVNLKDNSLIRKTRDSFGGITAPEGPEPYITTFWWNRTISEDFKLLGLGIKFAPRYFIAPKKVARKIVKESEDGELHGDRIGWKNYKPKLYKDTIRERNLRHHNRNSVHRAEQDTDRNWWTDILEWFSSNSRGYDFSWISMRHREFNKPVLNASMGCVNDRDVVMMSMDHLLTAYEGMLGSEFTIIESVKSAAWPPDPNLSYMDKLKNDPPHKYLKRESMETDEQNLGKDCYLYTYARKNSGDYEDELGRYQMREWVKSKILDIEPSSCAGNGPRCNLEIQIDSHHRLCSGSAELGSPVYCGEEKKLTYLLEKLPGIPDTPDCYPEFTAYKWATLWKEIDANLAKYVRED